MAEDRVQLRVGCAVVDGREGRILARRQSDPLSNPLGLLAAVGCAACTYLFVGGMLVTFPIAVTGGERYTKVLP